MSAVADLNPKTLELEGFRVGEHRARLRLAFAAVALLWLIALSNVSGLVLVETHRRSREMAMRTALGASRARIVSLVLQETLLLAIAGAAFGTAVSYWALQYVKLTFVMIPRISELVLDWRALLLAAATNAVAALTSGLIPALNGHTRRADPGGLAWCARSDRHVSHMATVTGRRPGGAQRPAVWVGVTTRAQLRESHSR